MNKKYNIYTKYIKRGDLLKKSILIAILGILVGFLNGIFGSGGGIILVPCLEKILNFETHKAHATSIFIMLFLSIASIFLYLKVVEIKLISILAICIGGMIGSFLGAKLLKKISSKLLNKIFGIFMIIASWRMLV